MSKLMAILKAGASNTETHQIPFSTRHKNEDGSPVLATVKPITAGQNNLYRKQASKVGRKGTLNFDQGLYQTLIIVNHTIDPDFKDQKEIEGWGVATPEQLADAVLSAGEYEALAKGILEISGFDESFDDIKDNAKN